MHAILFDIDGTLISSGGAGKAALEAALTAEFGVSHVIEKLLLSGRTDLAIATDLLRLGNLTNGPDSIARLRQAYLRHLPESLASLSGFVLPGIRELVGALAERDDVVLGLLTGNFREGAKVKLGHFGLFEYFRLGGYGDLHLDRDDVAREALAEVRQLLGEDFPAENVWVVGDTPLDIRCARAINARVVAVCTGWHSREELAEHRPDVLCDDLTDPEPWLSAM
jgi:phosphoglycolate phosphatase-like HAD superfamily hydrolase